MCVWAVEPPYHKCNNNNGLMIMFVISGPGSHEAGLRFMKCRRSGFRGPRICQHPFQSGMPGSHKEQSYVIPSICHPPSTHHFRINNSKGYGFNLRTLPDFIPFICVRKWTHEGIQIANIETQLRPLPSFSRLNALCVPCLDSSIDKSSAKRGKSP